jgi:hypothetical protein
VCVGGSPDAPTRQRGGVALLVASIVRALLLLLSHSDRLHGELLQVCLLGGLFLLLPLRLGRRPERRLLHDLLFRRPHRLGQVAVAVRELLHHKLAPIGRLAVCDGDQLGLGVRPRLDNAGQLEVVGARTKTCIGSRGLLGRAAHDGGGIGNGALLLLDDLVLRRRVQRVVLGLHDCRGSTLASLRLKRDDALRRSSLHLVSRLRHGLLFVEIGLQRHLRLQSLRLDAVLIGARQFVGRKVSRRELRLCGVHDHQPTGNRRRRGRQVPRTHRGKWSQAAENLRQVGEGAEGRAVAAQA